MPRDSSLRVKFDDANSDAVKSTDKSEGIWNHVAQYTDIKCLVSSYKLKLAATYVEDARLGRHSSFEPSEQKLRLYRQYHRPLSRVVLCAALLCHLSLAMFEEPAIPGCSMPYWVSLSLESSFLLFYCWRLVLMFSFSQRSNFLSDPKNIILASSILLSFLDMVVYVGLRTNGLYAVRLSRVLRPVMCACWPELRSVRVALRILRRALPAVSHVAMLYCALLATAALMAYKMLGHRGLVLVSGRPYFSTYWDTLFDLYVLVTTANNPDIMMPAFNQHVVYVSFFVAFLVLCYFIYMNVVLAVIYNSYKRHLKAEVLESFMNRQRQLQLAFDLLAHSPQKTAAGGCEKAAGAVVCRARFLQLLSSLPQRRSPSLLAVFFAVLDADNTGHIERVEFLRLSELLSVEVSEILPQSSCFRRAARRLPRISSALTKMVNSRWFQYFFDLLTMLNAIVIGCSGEDSSWDAPLEWCFLSFFMVEICLKLLTLGVTRFFRRVWNTFDFVVIGSAFVVGVMEALLDEERESRLSLDVLLVLRVLRLVKIVGSIKSSQMIVLTLAKILPSLRTYGGVILIFYYIFAIIGMELFSGLVTAAPYNTTTAASASSSSSTSSSANSSSNSNGGLEGQFLEYCGNPRLADTDYWRQRYCNNNFNDVLHALIVLFELTVVNQWHVMAYGFSAVTHPAARVFFLLFHLSVVTLLLNVFTAFVLEVFLLEYSASEGVMETQLESKILKLGLSETRRRRKSSTISHEELVMQDSSDDDDDYFFRRRRNSSRQDDHNDKIKGEPHLDNSHSDDTVDDSVSIKKKADDEKIRTDVENKSEKDSRDCQTHKIDVEKDELPNVSLFDIQHETNLVDLYEVHVNSEVDISTPKKIDKSFLTEVNPDGMGENTNTHKFKIDPWSVSSGSGPVCSSDDEKLATDNENSSRNTTQDSIDRSLGYSEPTSCTSDESIVCDTGGLKSSSEGIGSTLKDIDSSPKDIASSSEVRNSDTARKASIDRCECLKETLSDRLAAGVWLDTSVRFHLSKSVRSVEGLLQKLFQRELQEEFDKQEERRQRHLAVGDCEMTTHCDI